MNGAPRFLSLKHVKESDAVRKRVAKVLEECAGGDTSGIFATVGSPAPLEVLAVLVEAAKEIGCVCRERYGCDWGACIGCRAARMARALAGVKHG